jgi:hypothetical protein
MRRLGRKATRKKQTHTARFVWSVPDPSLATPLPPGYYGELEIVALEAGISHRSSV